MSLLITEVGTNLNNLFYYVPHRASFSIGRTLSTVSATLCYTIFEFSCNIGLLEYLKLIQVVICTLDVVFKSSVLIIYLLFLDQLTQAQCKQLTRAI